jgi:hypothetical protein
MKSIANGWIPSLNGNKLQLERLYAFPSQPTAKAFVNATGNYMSSPNISVLLEKIQGKSCVLATIRTRQDEFLLESAELITQEIDRMYDQFACAEAEASA